MVMVGWQQANLISKEMRSTLEAKILKIIQIGGIYKILNDCRYHIGTMNDLRKENEISVDPMIGFHSRSYVNDSLLWFPILVFVPTTPNPLPLMKIPKIGEETIFKLTHRCVSAKIKVESSSWWWGASLWTLIAGLRSIRGWETCGERWAERRAQPNR